MKKLLILAIPFFMFLVGPAAAQEDLDKVNIGFIGPLTGPAAYIGLDSLYGAEVAAYEVNQQGGFVVGDKKYLLEIASYDDQMVAAKSVAGLKSLKDKHDIPVANNNLSGTIMALLEVNEETNVLVGGFARHPAATESGNKLFLRHQVAVTIDQGNFAQDALNYYKPKNVAIISDVSDYGRQVSKVWLEVLNKAGVEVVAHEWFDQAKETDLRTQLTKIRAKKPDLVFVAAYDEGSAAARNQGWELGVRVPFAFTLGLQKKGFEMIGKERLEGCARIMQHDMLTPMPRGVSNYNRLYKELAEKKRGWPDEPGAYGGNVYEFIWTIILSMEKAKSLDPYKIREAASGVFPLPGEHYYIGLTGYLENGEGVMEKYFAVIRDGVLVPVR